MNRIENIPYRILNIHMNLMNIANYLIIWFFDKMGESLLLKGVF